MIGNIPRKGYLFMEEYHPPGYDGATGDSGFRVKPLDPKCRELNRHYVLPIGYELNNMLITNLGSCGLYEFRIV